MTGQGNAHGIRCSATQRIVGPGARHSCGQVGEEKGRRIDVTSQAETRIRCRGSQDSPSYAGRPMRWADKRIGVDDHEST